MALKKGQKQLLMLVAVFLGPVLVAFFLVQNMGVFGEFTTKNHGELIKPARLLVDVELKDMAGKKFSISDLHGKWVLVYLGSSSCNETCKENLYKMRQARLSQGGEVKRIERVYISVNGQPDAAFSTLLNEHSGLNVVYGDTQNVNQVLQQFALDYSQIQSEDFGLHIIDPLGNLMMRYPTGYAAKGLAKDLALLLKASFAG